MKKVKIIPLILCGGKGTRLWPLSRKSYPKQFLSLYQEELNDKSLLQSTYERLNGLQNIVEPILICNEEHRFLVAEQMRNINVKPKAIILEDEGRNTAPAITLGAFKALEDDENSLLLVLSADHLIKDVSLFKMVLTQAFKYAQEENLVTFGVIPNRPETGYGYIESESPLNIKNIEGSKINSFIEKPNEELAKKLIQSKRYTWNSGMFVFKTKTILQELRQHAPLVMNQCGKAMKESNKDLDFIRIEKNSFSKAPNISIDVAVMEKTSKGIVIPLDAGWSDLGSWGSLWDSEKKDTLGNAIIGNVFNQDSTNCYLNSEDRLLVTLGLKDLIVVDTADATLVANKQKSDQLKSIVNKLEEKGLKESVFHKRIFRPWGSYTSLIEREGWLLKIIEVNPGLKLSLQMHSHRSEHWIVVSGNAEVQLDEQKFILKNNQSTYIPIGSCHRLSNPTNKPLVMIEVQIGDFISETDIIRFEDDYGRDLN